MAQLQIIQDPYAGETSAAVNSLAGGFMPDPKGAAEAQELAARIRMSNQQQQDLQQKMKFAEEDRKKMQIAEDAAGRYFGYATPAPVGVNGAPPSREALEKYYRDQNYRDQASRVAIRSGKGTEDIAKGMADYETNFRVTHPAPNNAPTTLPDGSPIPVMPSNLSPDAQKKWNETTGKEVADAQMDQIASQAAARKKLPELVNMRDAWEAAAKEDAIGGFSATAPARWAAGALGTPREIARQNYEGVRSQVLNQNSGDHKGEGAVSNYERDLYGKPYAEVNAASPEVGRTRMTDQFALTLRNVGVDSGRAQEIALHITHGAPRAAIDRLVNDLKQGNTAGLDQFLEAARLSANQRMGGQ